MERLEILMAQVKENTNITNGNGIKDSNIIRHFNHTQKMIQSLVYQAKLEPNSFVGTIVVTPAEVTAELPADTFAENSILYVEPLDYPGRTLNKIQSSERTKKAGYFIENGFIGFSQGLISQYTSFTVKYFRRLPDLDIRRGKISNRTTTVLTLTSPSDKIGVLSDFVTVVDQDGNIIQADMRVVSFISPFITVENVNDDVTTDHYVVCGGYATTNSELPDECLPMLLDQVEKRVFSKNASKETANQSQFTDEQRSALLALFSDNSADQLYPPMTDTSFNF